MAGAPPNPPLAGPHTASPAGGFIGAEALHNFNTNNVRSALEADPTFPLPRAGIIQLESEVCASLPRFNDQVAFLVENEWLNNFIGPLSSTDDQPLGGPRVLKQPMQMHPNALIQGGPDLENLIDALENMAPSIQDPATKEKLEKFLSIYTATNSLKGFHRFLHRDQPRLTREPLPDGSNLGDRSINPDGDATLVHEWKLHRFWIRFLHYKGVLYHPSISSRIQKFGALYRTGRYLQVKELAEIRPNTLDRYQLRSVDPNSVDMSWVQNSRGVILLILLQVASLAFVQPQPRPIMTALVNMGIRQQVPNLHTMTREQRLDWNLKYDPELLDRMLNLLNQLLAQNPFERLILDLLVKEDTFERQLATEHVEDMLINKQMSVFDEDNFPQIPKNNSALPYFAALDKPETLYAKIETLMYKTLEETALVNRQRRNFRLLRDWQKKRPWKQIHQIYDDTLPGNQWLTAAIQTFQQSTYLPNRTGTLSPDTDITSYRTIAPSLFGFMPLLLSSLPPNHALRSPCTLCSQPFKGNQDFGSSVVELHCTAAHHFHLNCIFTFWDQPGKYLHRCPTCREAAQLNWQRVGLDPHTLTFAHNIGGWDVSHDTMERLSDDTVAGRLARDLYDVPPIPGPIDYSNPEDVHDGARKWWMRQNMSWICMDENPLNWHTHTFEPFQLARIRRPPLGRNEIDAYPYDGVARGLGRRWMGLEFDTGGRTRDPEQDVWGTEGERVLPANRYAPSAEAAWARWQRRRRNRKRREKVRESGRGLGSLPGV